MTAIDGSKNRFRRRTIPIPEEILWQRLSGASIAVEGMNPYMAARLLVHSDLKMLTKIYDHTSPETLRHALLKARNQGTPPSGAPTS